MTSHSIEVLRLSAYDRNELAGLFGQYGLVLQIGPDDAAIEGSFWGGEEAGLAGQRLLARSDTPLHSLLHEACHYICMDKQRRQTLNTDAGGDYDEENAVCYLQIILAGILPGIGRERMCRDMDLWGYSFRLGSARGWFEQDAQDARQWLIRHDIITESNTVTYRVRDE